MENPDFTGIIPILVTPFDGQNRIDADSLQSLIEFNIDAGVHGLGIAIGSELYKMDAAERDEILKLTVAAVRGRVPVVMNVSAQGTDLTVAQARRAAELGADALMLFPPSFMPTGPDSGADCFEAVGRATPLPLILQDVVQGPIPAAMARAVLAHCPTARAIKVETMPTVSQVGAMAAQVADSLTVIGGLAGTYMIEEFRRGARGTMPFCSQPAAFVSVWDHLLAGDEAAAREVFDREIMAVNRLGAQQHDLFYHVHKQMLVKKGVIARADVRAPTALPDRITQGEIDALIG
ncbi:dihydrodipicolinate synthase family protein [Oceaniglobus trochenteri]|uniref:dihydrodipicolinate synthase family protein n=1 Tax=Oceaniglobus trochenteri TaxID=2763260 RepID=UPI001CFF6801|nr:dihydrodipicolinate synthase family protein [Oceaniglobus trochenteri]